MSNVFQDDFVPNIEGAAYFPKWASANKKGDAPKWAVFRDAVLTYKQGDFITVPTMATKFGKALVAAGKLHMSVIDLGAVYVQSAPSVPTGLTAVGGDGVINMSWNANASTEAVDYYQVYEADQYRSAWLTIPSTSYVMTTDHNGNPLVNGTTYNVRVGAHNSAGYGTYSSAIAVTPHATAPPINRYTDIAFAAGKYDGEGWNSVFEAYQSDPRLATWGGQDPINYDNYGMTTDQNQRVYLFHPSSRGLPPNPTGSLWASWQELRTTDGPWESTLQDPYRLAKSSLSTNQPYSTWGSGGFTVGAVRWFAWDLLFPLSIDTGVSANGTTIVSFEFVENSINGGAWHTIFDLHASSGVDGDPCLGDITSTTYTHSSHPKYLSFTQSPDTRSGVGVPYINVPLVQLSNSNGTRFTANYNVWHEIVVGMKASKDSTGWYELWVNGVQVAPQTSRIMLNSAEQGPYVQAQNYCGYPETFIGGAARSAIVYGGFRAGLARTDVQRR